MNNPLQQVNALGQSVWYDNIRRGHIKSGELQRLIDSGITGLTSNPTIFEKAIAGSTDYDDALLTLVADRKSASDIFESLATQDIRDAADLMRSIYEQVDGADGFASFEVSPHLAHDTEGTISEGRRLFALLDRPNVMIKVPATPEGVPAVRQLISEGINVNVTLIFSLEAYDQVREAYIGGLEELAASGGDVSRVASVASFFVSRVDSAVDALLDERSRAGSEDLEDLVSKAAIANAKLAYRDFQNVFGNDRFAALRARGAKVQRPLWASTSTKNPALSDVLYVESLIGRDTVNTVPEATLTAFLEHGNAAETLEQDLGDAEQTIESLRDAGVSMEQVTAKLLADGVKSFADSFDKLIENIEEKTSRLLASQHAHPTTELGGYLSEVEATLEDLEKRDVVGRIWRRDHTVWKSEPEEITNRLGWLTVTDAMCEHVEELDAFSKEVRDAGFRHVVLLGMGGSSLGPEVLRQTFGSIDGHPELFVLDSTVPGWVQSVTDAIDPAHTLFLVPSKSGSTVEPNTFYRYFRSLVDSAVGQERAGQNFVAITDPGSSLETLGHEHGFRRVFKNPPDIGGRYSVQSYFGLVPAALMGVDITLLLDRVDSMREGCASFVPVHDNPGAWLGTIIGTLSLKGRDKLTLITSPSIGSFGLWVEQLIAESTGKEGRGIVPVAGEPVLAPESYGEDRLFIYLRVDGDDNAQNDAATENLASSGHPVVRLDLRDRYDLGGEFFRWEFATAVAGAILGIQPFDQPNVQQAKDLTTQALKEFQTSGKAPTAEATDTFAELLSKAKAGDYLAIMAYMQHSPETDEALDSLRRTVMERYHIATTVGYGPRFLHSTGQLHKGGPDSGLFLQLTAAHQDDIGIPEESYTFGILADAQAEGDLMALQTIGRRAAKVRLESDTADAIKKLVAEIG